MPGGRPLRLAIPSPRIYSGRSDAVLFDLVGGRLRQLANDPDVPRDHDLVQRDDLPTPEPLELYVCSRPGLTNTLAQLAADAVRPVLTAATLPRSA